MQLAGGYHGGCGGCRIHRHMYAILQDLMFGRIYVLEIKFYHSYIEVQAQTEVLNLGLNQRYSDQCND